MIIAGMETTRIKCYSCDRVRQCWYCGCGMTRCRECTAYQGLGCYDSCPDGLSRSEVGEMYDHNYLQGEVKELLGW